MTVASTEGFPEDRKLGITRGGFEYLRIDEVMEGSWTYRCTNLREYIGWSFIKINSHAINNDADFEEAKKSWITGQTMVFILKKVRLFIGKFKRNHIRKRYVRKYYVPFLH